MKRELGYSAIFFTATLMFFAMVPQSAMSTTQSALGRTSAISLSEAEILIYVMPDSVAIRDKGRDVILEVTTSAELNQSDYYFFDVSFTGPTAASRLVGHYAINKRTADVLNSIPTAHIVTSRQLSGVQ